MGQTKTKTKTVGTASAPFSEGLAFFSESFLPRTKDIVRSRFGLSGTGPKTLEDIGQSYGITRERVRQILSGAFASVKQRRDDPVFLSVSGRVTDAISGHSGIVPVDELPFMLVGGSRTEAGALSFFLECMKTVKEERETADRVRSFVLTGFPKEEWAATHSVALETLRSADHALTENECYAKAKANGLSVDRKRFFDYLASSSRIRKNPFGRWGLAESGEIAPRGTREKAYLVLKMHGSPMHFKEIAAGIDSAGLQKRGRKTHPQTVHNELIKDAKFVLVGRGLYALSEWGFEKGTVREVIGGILKRSAVPLSRDDIVSEVLRTRRVKTSTIVINLNAFFDKVGKDRYTLKREAVRK
jgi:hypothetical protein